MTGNVPSSKANLHRLPSGAVPTASVFVRRYPTAAVSGKMVRISHVLTAHYLKCGYNVGGCSSWQNAVRRILPGEVWLVWSEGSDLRVIGMAKPSSKERMNRRAIREFRQHVHGLGKPERLDFRST